MLFPQASDGLFMQWPSCFDRIMTYAEKQVDWEHLLRFNGNLDTGIYYNSKSLLYLK